MISLAAALGVAAALAGGGRTIVVSFDDLSAQPSHSWVGEGFAEALSSYIQSAGQDVVELFELQGYLEEKGLSIRAPLTRATIIMMGRGLGASRAVVGSYRFEADRIDVTAKVIDLQKGAITGVIEDYGETDDIIALENQLALNFFRLEGDPVPESFRHFAERRRAIPLEAHEKLARARGEVNKSERRTLLEKALEIYPGYGEARLLLGRVLLALDEPVEAIRVLTAFAPGDFFYREAYFLLGLSYLAANQTGAAAEIFSNLAEQENEAPFWNNLGVALLRTGDIEKAVEAFSNAVDLEPNETAYLFNVGWANWRAGKGGEALGWARRAVMDSPDDPEAHFLLSAAAAAQALPDEAGREKELAIGLSPRLAGVDPSTAEGLERVIERMPLRSEGSPLDSIGDEMDSTGEALESARAHRAAGRLEEAIRELQQALYLQPHWVDARLELAEIYLESGELDRSLGEYRVALWHEETASTHVRLAEIYLEMGDSAQARFHVEKALEMEPESAEARDLLDKLKALQQL